MSTLTVAELAAAVPPVDTAAAAAAHQRHDELAKPPGSLGKLERLGAQLAGLSGTCPPPIPEQPAVLIGAGDHGVHVEGVSRWPQEVSTAMAGQLLAGRASANALARQTGAAVTVLDVGLRTAPPPHPMLRGPRVRSGTRNLAVEPALTHDETEAAIVAGASAAADLLAAGTDLLVVGEIGIANTTPSAALIAWFTGREAADVTGRGAGSDDATLARKVAAVEAAVRRHATTGAPHRPASTASASSPQLADTVAALASLGGLEHAALTGAMLAAAPRIPVVLDGVTTLAAALVATRLAPPIAGRLIAGHRSVEPGATAALAALHLDPLFELELRLGEGTGGLLAVPVVQAAARLLQEVATLTETVARAEERPVG